MQGPPTMKPSGSGRPRHQPAPGHKHHHALWHVVCVQSDDNAAERAAPRRDVEENLLGDGGFVVRHAARRRRKLHEQVSKR
eukprot:49502-Chlamydomonas_euryale.AAC.1